MSLYMLGIGSIIEGIGKVADETPIKSSVRPAPSAMLRTKGFVEGLAAIHRLGRRHRAGLPIHPLPADGMGLAFFQAHGRMPDTLKPPPALPAEQLWVILSGMLGIAGLRSFDKLKGTNTAQVGAPEAGN
jgi:hypothetical protein